MAEEDSSVPKNDGWFASDIVQRGEDVKVRNTMSSVAGAGSGDFHTYRTLRRMEANRMEKIEKDSKKREADTEFEARQRERHQEEQAKLQKKSSKRQKKKQKALHAKIRKKWEKSLQGIEGQVKEEEKTKDTTDTKEKEKEKDESIEARVKLEEIQTSN